MKRLKEIFRYLCSLFRQGTDKKENLSIIEFPELKDEEYVTSKTIQEVMMILEEKIKIEEIGKIKDLFNLLDKKIDDFMILFDGQMRSMTEIKKEIEAIPHMEEKMMKITENLNSFILEKSEEIKNISILVQEEQSYQDIEHLINKKMIELEERLDIKKIKEPVPAICSSCQETIVQYIHISNKNILCRRCYKEITCR